MDARIQGGLASTVIHLSSNGAVSVGVMTVITFVCPKSTVAPLSSRKNCTTAGEGGEKTRLDTLLAALSNFQGRGSPGMISFGVHMASCHPPSAPP